MTDFADRPFVAGSLTGLRAFVPTADGRLLGPATGMSFNPGTNHAVCPIDAQNRALHRVFQNVMSSLIPAHQRQPAPTHTVASVDCMCGFYAYFDGRNDYARHDRVTALVEGFGVCTVGSRGFRASKARLVALVLPSARRRNIGRVFDWAVLAFVAAMTVLNIFQGDTTWFIVLGSVLGANLALRWSTYRQNRKNPTPALPRDSIAARYPDVPVYPTVRAALRAHPLTPTPEAHQTRRARFLAKAIRR